MAPKRTKQGVLPLHLFCKDPTIKTYNKHKKLTQKLEKKKINITGKPPAWRVKKEKEAERKRQADEEEAGKWREWLKVKGVVGNGRIDPMQMFKVWGKAPPLEAPNGTLYQDGELDSSSSESDGVMEEDIEEVEVDGLGDSSKEE